MIRLAIVEDHPAVADGLMALLRDRPEISVVGSAPDLAAAIALVERESPDVVLCDIRLANAGDGFELVGRHPEASFIMLSAHTYPSFYVRASELGAKGFLSKMATLEQILQAVTTVANGGTAFPDDARRVLRQALRSPSARELEIIRLVADGHSNVEIAERLSLRLKTVESQLRRLFDRYDLTNRTALVSLAQRQGWIDAPG